MNDTTTPVPRPADAHECATHIDSFGMPVAFFTPDAELAEAFPHIYNEPQAYYPTPCCGASAKGCDGYIGCRKCYQPIDPSFGGVPQEPYTPLVPA